MDAQGTSREPEPQIPVVDDPELLMRDALRDYPELIPNAAREAGLPVATVQRWLQDGAAVLSSSESLALLRWSFQMLEQPFPPPRPKASEAEGAPELPALTWIRETLAPIVTRWQADAEALSCEVPVNYLAGWLASYIPALGGKRPLDFVETEDGRDLVLRLHLSQESGTYW